MPITIDAVSATANNAAASLQLQLVVGVNAKAMVVFTGSDNARSVSAMAWNGAPLTKLGFCSSGSRCSEIWVLTTPEQTTAILKVEFVGAGGCAVLAATYNGVADVNGFGTANLVTSGAATVANLSISSTTTDLVAFMFAQIANNNTIDLSNGTSRRSACVSTTIRLSMGDIAGAAPVTISCVSTTSNAWMMLGVPLVFSAAAATVRMGSRSLLGAGY